MALTLTSSSFKEGATLGMDQILSADYGFGCGGGNKSPQLSWSGAPAGTRSASAAAATIVPGKLHSLRGHVVC